MSANVKKVLIVVVVALALFFVFNEPAPAGQLVNNVVTDGLSLLGQAADRVITFMENLA